MRMDCSTDLLNQSENSAMFVSVKKAFTQYGQAYMLRQLLLSKMQDVKVKEIIGMNHQMGLYTVN